MTSIQTATCSTHRSNWTNTNKAGVRIKSNQIKSNAVTNDSNNKGLLTSVRSTELLIKNIQKSL